MESKVLAHPGWRLRSFPPVFFCYPRSEFIAPIVVLTPWPEGLLQTLSFKERVHNSGNLFHGNSTVNVHFFTIVNLLQSLLITKFSHP